MPSEEGANEVNQQDAVPAENKTEVKTSPVKKTKPVKMQLCRVLLLDGTEYEVELDKKAKGQQLFDMICDHLNLLEKDYFGITYRDPQDQKYWLDPLKEIRKQIKEEGEGMLPSAEIGGGPWVFGFNVKFYPPDPSQLQEDITRYQLCLQIRDDILKGRLPCSFVTHALLGSYIVQSELGDYDPEEHSADYLSEFKFAPNQTKELEEKVMELHKTHKGQTPAEAELHYLENAKKLAMYGVDLHHAKDSEGVDIMLGVCANGLLIYRDRLRINRFAWPKILKISYKRSNFYIKIRPGEFEQFESTIGFKLPNHRAAKRLWKVCVEHHTFFRLVSPEPPPKSKILRLGSKFRYSGRTQHQTRQISALIDRPAPNFERTLSKRFSSKSMDAGLWTSPGYAPYREQNRPDLSKLPPDMSASADAVGAGKLPYADDVPPQGDEIPFIDADTTDDFYSAYSRPGNKKSQGEKDAEQQRRQKNIHEMKMEFLSQTPQPAPGGWDARTPPKTLSEQKEEKEEHEEAAVQETVPPVAEPEVNGTETHAAPEEPAPPEELTNKVDDEIPNVENAVVDELESQEPPTVEVKTETVKYVASDEAQPEFTSSVPIVKTESKTITYEQNEDGEPDQDPGVLVSAQTVTSETISTTTTTHITKTVKGGVAETRIEKRIVITGDTDIDHDQYMKKDGTLETHMERTTVLTGESNQDEALADLIKEAADQNPDMTVTKVVVHKEEGEQQVTTNGTGEDD
ncbi:protein 4.1-like isoform X7 [Branchiostoma lanceolatum]|uniref:protein 4.1-like isoform X7 n=1 Tax=Branchiostoma lanceolatum TaxID=7740 RepID=UPI003454CE94